MSASMRKMKLVSEAELDRLRAKQVRDYDPEIYVLAQLQKQIDEAMTNPRISDYDKMTLLQNAQHRYRAISQKDAMERAGFSVDSTPKLPAAGIRAAPTPAAPAPPATEAVPEEAAVVEEVPAVEPRDDVYIAKLPITYRNKAAKFFDWIKGHKDQVSYDDNNRLVINGVPVAGSDFQALLRNLYVHNKKAKPTGSIQFASALRGIGLPPTLISNKEAISLRKAPTKGQKGKGLKFIRMRSHSRSPSPPGRKPVVLRVYPDV